MKHRTRAAGQENSGKIAPGSSRSKISLRHAGRLAGAFVIALAVWFTYRGPLDGPFIFDDVPTIIGNTSIRSLWPLVSFSDRRGPLQPPPQTSVTGRPVANLSLAIDYHFSQLRPRGYRITNIVLHALAAIVLAVVVRRTLCLEFFQGRFAAVADPLAFAAGLLWALHPLNTESVAYVTQRNEVLMGLMYLLTLDFAQHYWSAERRGTRAAWLVCATVACQLGMLTKEMMLSAPAMVLLYERTFLQGSFRRALLKSWPLYLGLATAWLSLALWNLQGPSTEAGGFHLGISALEWWCTQAKVVFLYLKLTIWPWPLVVHYEMPYLNTVALAWPWVLGAAVLLIGVLVLVARGTALGFVGAWFFAILSPTLVIPIATEVAAERRMYVALAAVIPAAVTGCYMLVRHIVERRASSRRRSTSNAPLMMTLLIALVLAGAYGLIDVQRLEVYKNAYAFWSDAAENQPDSPLVLLNLGGALEDLGRRAEALPYYERAVQIQPNLFMCHFRLAEALAGTGRFEEAEPQYQEAVRLNPEMAAGHYGLGQTLRRLGKTQEAKGQLELAVNIFPGFARAHFALGGLAEQEGNRAAAREHYESAIRAQGNFAAARRALGLLLMEAGEVSEAIEQFRRMPPSADACGNLAIAYSRIGRSKEALAMAEAGALMARSQGQADQAAQLEAWAKSYHQSLPAATSDRALPDGKAP